MSVTALIVAAGKGERLGGGVPKQFRELGGWAVLRWAVEPFIRHSRVDQVRVVVGADQRGLAEQVLGDVDVGELITGAEERAFSTINGLEALRGQTDHVLVHDAARPFCPSAVIDRLLDALGAHDGAVPVLAAADTLTKVSDAATLGDPVDRTGIFRVQTPQGFRLQTLIDAYQDWRAAPPTDEAAYLTAKRIPVAAVAGDAELEKLTTAADFERAERLLASRLVPRTGMGFDVHAFAGDGPIMLGGVEIPHNRGLAGHSDADVALHAITDALLGAAALGDIGQHFPPSDEQWKGAASDRFLDHAGLLIGLAGGIIDHVDCTIIAEAPKVGPYRDAMRSRIATILDLKETQVSIKATTTEGLGFTGRREGIAAQAIASVRMPAHG